MRNVVVAVLALMLVASGCTSQAASRVVVSVSIDREVLDATSAVRVRVFGGTDGADVTSFEETRPRAALLWPAELTIVPDDGDARRTWRVEITALGDALQPIAIVRASSGFVANETRVLHLRLDAACLGMISCSEQQTCETGDCVDAYVDPRSLAALGADAAARPPADAGRGDADPGPDPDGGRRDPDGGIELDGGCEEIASYADADEDGYGDPATLTMACTIPSGNVARADDCDDSCPTCRPTGIETCDGALDEDCDGTPDEGCSCTGGAMRACPAGTDVGECVAGAQTCVEGVWGPCDDRIDPVPEDCDGRDDDCDGSTDESLTRECGIAVGACAVGTETCEAGRWTGCTATTPGTETCNRVDDDCDGTTDEGTTRTFFRDADGDGYGIASATTTACTAPDGYSEMAGDCNDSCRTCRPGGAEVCDGMLDENCVGGVDEGCACSSGDSRACPEGVETGECTAGTQTCSGGAWGSCAGQRGPMLETCNARDDDCDARIDESLVQGCGPATEAGVCRRGTQSCSAGAWSACMGAIMPGTESCNGMDDDCDGTADNGVLTTFYADGDADGYGVATSTRQACTRPAGFAAMSGDCDDSRATVYPGATEICDGLDQDCDSRIDDGASCPVDAGPSSMPDAGVASDDGG
jgi:hypothetical protein